MDADFIHTMRLNSRPAIQFITQKYATWWIIAHITDKTG